jgi:hypothetical protein
MAGRKAGDDLFVARQSFATIVDGATVIIQQGTVVDSGDPVLKGRKQLFEPFAPKIRNYPGRVEQATAAPGEKR